METHSLENSITALKWVRDAYSSQLDTSVMAELDLVIADLERVHDQQISGERWKELSMRSVQMIATILRLISDVQDWMK